MNLRQGITTCPVVQHSLDIITNSLRSEAIHISPINDDHNGDTTTVAETLAASNYLPAFPYPGVEIGQLADTNARDMDLDAFSLLD